MQYACNQLVYSPSDLVVYLDGDFASWMDRWQTEFRNRNQAVATDQGLPLGIKIDGVTCQPDVPDAELQLIAAKGQEFEAAYLQQLRSDGHDVVEVPSGLSAADQLS